MANIKFTGNGPGRGEIHIIASSTKTACGKNYADNRDEWVKTNESVTCEKNGCKQHI